MSSRLALAAFLALLAGGCMSPVAVADCSRKPDRAREADREPDAGAGGDAR